MTELRVTRELLVVSRLEFELILASIDVHNKRAALQGKVAFNFLHLFGSNIGTLSRRTSGDPLARSLQPPTSCC